ncbi:hypothetical protein [Nocardia iowensis]|uniref:SnoaL-like domain-containing protein n=1 Tax=Nocardia iowensis TaxID=204891 RepID=A0ABX8RZX5_NOCIO|nr:hypothetical protein [Nocardia iowensis]QXN95113.1 hypothetical protein KV110_19960 [Nocardia iowensis]
MGNNIGEKAIRCLRYLEACNFDNVRAMCTSTATVWHNDGRGEQAIGEKLEQLKPLVNTVESLRYEVARQFHNSNEVLQQNVLHLVMNDGSRSELHAAMYFRFKGDLIDRIEEYAYAVPIESDTIGSGVRMRDR